MNRLPTTSFLPDPPSIEEMFLANSMMEGSLVTNATGSIVSTINGPSVTAALSMTSIGLDFLPSRMSWISGTETRGLMSMRSGLISTSH